MPFQEIEAYQEAINPHDLLNEITEIIRRYIVLSEEQATATALLIANSWFINVMDIAPLTIINAPEKSCGKTQLLIVFGYMAYRPLETANATVPALFRAIALWRPTALIDEADTFFNKDNGELVGMVNAGYSSNGSVLRCEAVGDSYEPKTFPVYCAKVLAGIKLEKHLTEATMSRGIVINLKRKLSTELVHRLRHAPREDFNIIASKLARFAVDYSEQVKTAAKSITHSLPDKLSDREQDNWEGLLAIASCAGDDWYQKATRAALKMSSDNASLFSGISNSLLANIRDIFEAKECESIRTEDLITALCDDNELGWGTYNRGKPIVARQLNHNLSCYGVKSKQIRIGVIKIRGFEKSQFDEVFIRYLEEKEDEEKTISLTPPKLSGTCGTAYGDAAYSRYNKTNGTGTDSVYPVQKHCIDISANKSVPDSTGTEKKCTG